MSKFIVEATLTKTYKILVYAEDAEDAISRLDDWVADDFEQYETDVKWELEAH